eukprot:CAMPEP_0119306246 /NCGR_PEP_ID=MMETSP1333-20130426/7045_1 /TAXON_ID=418940 /ORGANISM="Scyphosphaera apsteinii, Strain RCC1455" /LENGTH=605 /DNA_ID=CAMNT_0007309501 /DNA_START=80 /DNA_END=1898 /DNA_ORIENTATION=-
MSEGLILGFLAALFAAIGWGSWQVVVKKYEGVLLDGFAFQLWMCTGILMVGLLTLAIAPVEPDYAPGADGHLGEVRPELPLLCSVGGMIWCLGNVVTVQMVKLIGMGLGMAIALGISILVAFVAGQLGPCIAGECLPVTELRFPAMGIGGCVCSVIGLALFSRVQTKPSGFVTLEAAAHADISFLAGVQVEAAKDKPAKDDLALRGDSQAELETAKDMPTNGKDRSSSVGSRTHSTPSTDYLLKPMLRKRPSTDDVGTAQAQNKAVSEVATPEPEKPAADSEPGSLAEGTAVSHNGLKIRGILLATFSGVMQGFQFLPCAVYSKQHGLGPAGLIGQVRLAFAQYLGIFTMSMFIYIAYHLHALACGSGPAKVPLDAMPPSMLAGVAWGLAGILAMLAMEELTYGVGYALTSNGAFLVSITWALFYFHEIRGARNIRLFSAAVFFNIVASALFAEQRALSTQNMLTQHALPPTAPLAADATLASLAMMPSSSPWDNADTNFSVEVQPHVLAATSRLSAAAASSPAMPLRLSRTTPAPNQTRRSPFGTKGSKGMPLAGPDLSFGGAFPFVSPPSPPHLTNVTVDPLMLYSRGSPTKAWGQAALGELA